MVSVTTSVTTSDPGSVTTNGTPSDSDHPLNDSSTSSTSFATTITIRTTQHILHENESFNATDGINSSASPDFESHSQAATESPHFESKPQLAASFESDPALNVTEQLKELALNEVDSMSEEHFFVTVNETEPDFATVRPSTFDAAFGINETSFVEQDGMKHQEIDHEVHVQEHGAAELHVPVQVPEQSTGQLDVPVDMEHHVHVPEHGESQLHGPVDMELHVHVPEHGGGQLHDLVNMEHVPEENESFEAMEKLKRTIPEEALTDQSPSTDKLMTEVVLAQEMNHPTTVPSTAVLSAPQIDSENVTSLDVTTEAMTSFDVTDESLPSPASLNEAEWFKTHHSRPLQRY